MIAFLKPSGNVPMMLRSGTPSLVRNQDQLDRLAAWLAR